MKLSFGLSALIGLTLSFHAYGGGNPEFVKFPEKYEQIFTKYDVANRANQTQLAKFYANKIAVESYKKGEEAAPGSVVVMEIYVPKKDAEDKILSGADGLFIIDKLAAVAVMEKRNDWDSAYNADDRSGGWGFALYDPAGVAKTNDLNCAQCHTPLQKQDNLFSFQKLVDYVKSH
ncbi:cytochrome P460 family protein [Nitrosomonas sp.]|uniref:cytochrome P460 family protein n=1 Tax=Nitrosomonas sp. TaxID=42353 RepID=UPI0025F835FB|nr:cytochrome P460 family protein [Nitrosomonas sp.]MCC6916228.1 cytochrome P460 family protein [Nitrosomonas sp.]